MPEGRATKARMASMERKGRDWSVSVSTVSLPFATLIVESLAGCPLMYLLFATAAALAGLSTMILFVTRYPDFHFDVPIMARDPTSLGSSGG